MTPKGTPDDEHRDGLPAEGSPDEHLPGPPPRPQWLDEDDEQDAAPPAEPPPPAKPEPEPAADADDNGKTQVVQQAAKPRPAPSPADFTMTDFSRGTGPEEGSDRTRAERGPTPPPAEPSAPLPPLPPFPWAQEVPGQQPAPPAPPQPQFPEQQPQPPAPQPPAPQPPAPQPPAPRPPAPEPFPWAQEVPGQQPAPPAAPEPFPWAQEIPGQQPALPAQSSGSAPFPYAQEIPGGGGPAAATPAPAPPLPQPDEPWRTGRPPNRKKGRGKKIVFGVVGGVAVVALVAAGVYVLVLDKDDSDGGGGGAQLAGKLFPADPAARSDGRDQELTGVASSGGTVVAVGGEASPGDYRGVFLVSADGGRTFKSAEVDGEPAAGEAPRVVAGAQGGWVAIGTRPNGGAVWTSEDGRTWRRQPDAAGDVFAGGRLTQVIRTGKGFLALGERSRKGDFSDSTPAVWTSPDGRNWNGLSGSQIGVPLRGRVVLEEAASNGASVLMESAHTPKPGAGSFRRAWRSADGGRTWTPAKIPAPKGTRGLRIGGGKAGLIAVREVMSGKSAYGAVFTSTDGAEWKAAGKLAPSGYQQVKQLTATDSGYAAVVARGGDLLVSRSADGASWQDAGTLPGASGRTLLGVSATGEQTVLVGRDAGTGDLDALLAVRDARGAEVQVDPLKIPGAFHTDQTVSAVAAEGGRAVAVGGTGGDAAIWTSADGSAWTRTRFSGGVSRPALQRLTSVAHGGSGWLAVGEGGGNPAGPLVMTSEDGNLWRPADTDPVFQRKGSTPLSTHGAAASQAGYVVVGDDGPSGSIWFSPDLKTWQRGGGVGRDDLTAKNIKADQQRAGKESGRVTVEAPLHVSNVAIVEDGKAVRVGYRIDENDDGTKTKVRISRRSGKEI